MRRAFSITLHPPFPLRFRDLRNLHQEVASIRILRAALVAAPVADELRHDVRVPGGREEHGHVAERPIRAHLFESGLDQAPAIPSVFLVGPADDFPAISQHALLAHQRPALIVLMKGKRVLPTRTVVRPLQVHVNLDVALASRCQAANRLHAAAPPDGFLKTAAR